MKAHKGADMNQKSVQESGLLGHFSKSDTRRLRLIPTAAGPTGVDLTKALSPIERPLSSSDLKGNAAAWAALF